MAERHVRVHLLLLRVRWTHDSPQLGHRLVVRDDLWWKARILGHEHERLAVRIGLEEALVSLRPVIPHEQWASLFDAGEITLPDKRGEGDGPETIRTDLPQAIGSERFSGTGTQRRAGRRGGALNVLRRAGYLRSWSI